jgi:hypothetical protein
MAAKRKDILAARPRRASDALLERTSGGALVKMPISARWPFRLPKGATKTFELDEMGLWVWDACDGNATLLDVITRFAKHFGLTVREAEVSTTKFLEMLAMRKLVTIQ